MFMPSVAQLGITEWKQFEQLFFKNFLGNGLATLNHCTSQDGSRGSQLA